MLDLVNISSKSIIQDHTWFYYKSSSSFCPPLNLTLLRVSKIIFIVGIGIRLLLLWCF